MTDDAEKKPGTMTWDEVMGDTTAASNERVSMSVDGFMAAEPSTDTAHLPPDWLPVSEVARTLIPDAPAQGWDVAYMQLGMAHDAELWAEQAQARGDQVMWAEYKRQAADHRETARKAVSPELNEEIAAEKIRRSDA